MPVSRFSRVREPEAAMKTKSELMVWVLGLGVMATAGVSMKAQETGAVAAPGAVTAPMDNGAMPGDSHVRIVRLSSVQGTLALDRKTGLGFEQTMQNMPIIQGQRLRTEEIGRASCRERVCLAV